MSELSVTAVKGAPGNWTVQLDGMHIGVVSGAKELRFAFTAPVGVHSVTRYPTLMHAARALRDLELSRRGHEGVLFR